jgi:hypothetical protein
MRLALAASLALGATLAASTPVTGQTVLTARETVAEATVNARYLIAHRGDGIGTLISNFAANDTQAGAHGIAGRPTGLLEYYAPVPPSLAPSGGCS